MAAHGSSGSSGRRWATGLSTKGDHALRNCPYGRGNNRCPFQGSQDEVDDHVTYMASIGDEDHQEEKRR